MFTPLADIQSWLDVLHGVLRFPVSIATFVHRGDLVGGRPRRADLLSCGTGPCRIPQDNYELPELLGFADTAANRISFYLVVGVVFAFTLPFVVRGCALLEAWLGRALLTGVAELRDQVADLTEGRATARAQTAAAVSAEATALRRLERDIHDGPQQRLVRLAVDLGRAQQQFDPDPDAARAHRRRGDRADPRGARRTAHAVPRHRPADPDRPRAGRRRSPRWRPGPPCRSSLDIPDARPPAGAGRADRVLHHRRGTDQLAKHSGADPGRRCRVPRSATG